MQNMFSVKKFHQWGQSEVKQKILKSKKSYIDLKTFRRKMKNCDRPDSLEMFIKFLKLWNSYHGGTQYPQMQKKISKADNIPKSGPLTKITQREQRRLTQEGKKHTDHPKNCSPPHCLG